MLARDRMLELTSAPDGSAARAHFLSIVQGAGTLQFFGEMAVELMPEYEVELEGDLEVILDDTEYVVTLEYEFDVEVC